MAISNALVVDDSRLARLTLTKLLEKRQIEVEKASSAREAFEALKSNRPDIILMDVTMPDIDGLEATRMITNNPETSSIPVVMCTAEDSDEARAKAEACGATAFLTKPAGDENLDRVLSEIGQRISEERASQPQIDIPVTTAVEAEPHVAPVTASEDLLAAAREAARAVVEEMLGDRLHTLTDSATNSAFDAHRAELEASVVAAADSSARSVAESAAEQAARKAVEEIATDIARKAAEDAIRESVQSVATDIVQRETGAIGEALSGKLSEELESNLQAQLSGEAITQRIQNVAGETAERSAAEVAERTAQVTARETAAELARGEAREAARAAAEELVRNAGLEDALAAAAKATATARMALFAAGGALVAAVLIGLVL